MVAPALFCFVWIFRTLGGREEGGVREVLNAGALVLTQSSSKRAHVGKKAKRIIYMDKDWARVRDVWWSPRSCPKISTVTECQQWSGYMHTLRFVFIWDLRDFFLCEMGAESVSEILVLCVILWPLILISFDKLAKLLCSCGFIAAVSKALLGQAKGFVLYFSLCSFSAIH